MSPASVVAEHSPRNSLQQALDRSRGEELEEIARRHRPDRHLSLIVEWFAQWMRTPRRAAVEPLPDVAPGEVGVTWIGHASVLVRYARLTIACDPMLGRRLGAIRRSVDPGLTPAEHGDVGLILIGSAEPDRLHLPTLARLPRSATIVVPPRCAGLVSDLGFARTVELGIGQTLAHRGVEIASTSVRAPRRRGRSACAYVLRGDGPSLFICGGSGYFSGFTEIGEKHRPDVALLPIGGYVPRGLRAGAMSPLEALAAFEDLAARMLIPIRYGTFQLSYETLEEPVAWLERLVAERALGEHVAIVPPGASRKYS
jgi:L-ascorbate metabolism protein UlaG (beta-lactamase superfamily)